METQTRSSELRAAASSPDLEAAWRHIQADFRKAVARRDRLRSGQVGFWELMRSRSLSKLIREAEAEVERIHPMLKAIDRIRATALRTAELEEQH